MEIDGQAYVPFILGHAPLTASWQERSPIEGTRFLDVLDEENLLFFRLLNAGNAVAFGPAVMPAWVQFDLGTLPSAMVGFALPRTDVDPALWKGLREAHLERWPEDAERLDAYEGLVPIAEWCPAHTAERDTVVGFSLFSLAPGRRLGVRAKALALLLSGAAKQIGVTRREGPVRRAHEAIAPLRVVRDQPAPHPHPEDTFVYELEVPPAAILEAIVRSGRRPDADRA